MATVLLLPIMPAAKQNADCYAGRRVERQRPGRSCWPTGQNRIPSMASCLVSIQESTLALSVSLRTDPDEQLDSVIGRALNLLASTPCAVPQGQSPSTFSSFGKTRNRVAHSILIFGRKTVLSKKRDVLATLLGELSRRDSQFLARFANERGRSRRFVATSQEALYPGSPHLAKYSLAIGDGWWMATNCSERDIDRAAKRACEVAGVRYGEDVAIDFETTDGLRTGKR